MAIGTYISAAVEGIVDEAVVRAIASAIGLNVTAVFGKNGKAYLSAKLSAYNQAARYTPWMVLIDLDNDEECAPPLKQELLPKPAKHMCFRIAVREVESWLLADRERAASFFSVSKFRIPTYPEAESNPKQTMINIARQSKRRAIREDMVPREGSGRNVGPAYASRLIEFVTDSRKGWRCRVAAEGAESLKRCIECLNRFRGANVWQSEPGIKTRRG
jgi:hypothetical protein